MSDTMFGGPAILRLKSVYKNHSFYPNTPAHSARAEVSANIMPAT